MTSTQTIAGSFFSDNPVPLKKLCYTQPNQGEEVHTIKDNRGHHYRLEVYRALGPCFWVRHNGRKVAEALCEASGETLTLCDFQVQDDMQTPQSWLHRFARWLRRQPKPRKTYRRCGLGTSLLQFIIAWASKHGITEIKGSLSPRDLREFSNLKGWYRNNGFAIRPGGQYGVGEVYFAMPSANNSPK